MLGDDDFKAMWTLYDNEEVDQLIRAAQSETDPDARLEMYHQIQAMHLDDAPFIFLFYPTGRSATAELRQELPHPAHRQLPAVRDVAGRRVGRGDVRVSG